MDRFLLNCRKIWFGIFNFPFLFSLSEFNVLFWLNSHHRKKGYQWFLIAVVLNLAPFLISALIAYLTDPDSLLCFINNGSLPIIAFGIVSTNMVYLLENISTEREAYSNLKNSTLIYSVILIFPAAVLYIFQSNFLDHFTLGNLKASLWISLFVFIMSIVMGKKMFLLQSKLISMFDENFKEQMDSLQIVPNNTDIKF